PGEASGVGHVSGPPGRRAYAARPGRGAYPLREVPGRPIERSRAEGSRMASNDLIADVVQLPVRPGAAMRLLWMLDDTGASAADLGRLIDSDHELSTQVVRLANTPFYGLAGRVTSAWRAVTVLGLATLRAIATAAAFDLFADHGRPLPA